MRRCGKTVPPSNAVRAQHQRIAIEPLEGTAVNHGALCTIKVKGSKALESPIAYMDVCMYVCKVCMQSLYAKYACKVCVYVSKVFESSITCCMDAGYTRRVRAVKVQG